MSARVLESIDPTSGKRLRSWETLAPDELERRLAAAHTSQRRWAATSVAERCAVLARAAALLGERAEALARRMAEEMGKPLVQGRAEVEKCAAACSFYAEHAARMLADEPARPPRPDAREFVSFRPLGLVLAIMPWNFPLWQAVRALAPSLVAGNGVLLKHAANVQGCAEDLVALLGDAGLPAGLCPNLPLGHELVSALVRDPRVAALTLTGSSEAGRTLAALAGAALKKCVLELGGSDPYLVLADADLALAARTCVASRLINAGQSCIAAKRFICVAPVLEEFTALVLAELGAKTMGDPRTAVDLGPLARADLRATLHAQVRESVARGARLLLGGELPDGPGCFYPPTLLADVAPGQPAYSDELFGPAAAILAARDEAHAVQLANDTSFGLGAAVFSRDVERALALARDQLQAGSVCVNDFVRSDPRLPFGGIKDSGFGRELAHFGLREFVNVKTVVAPA